MKRAQLFQAGRMPLCAMYLRKSRAEEQLSLTQTLEKHRAALTDFAARRGLKIAEVFEEVVSGESLFARPQMLRLLERAAAGRYDAVLCMDMQRLGRGGMYDQGLILDTLKESGTLIVTPERVYDLTEELDEQAAEMETFLSRSEYRMISRRLRRGTLQAVESGAYLAAAPFGYRKVRAGRLSTLEIVPEEAEFVRYLFRLYAEGAGCTRIEETVNAMGFRGRRGSRFNRSTIRQILTNPVYIGKIRWDRTLTVREGVGSERKKRVVYNRPEAVRLLDGIHPPIVPQPLWDAVQQRRASFRACVDRRRAACPLAGLVRCAKCGRKLIYQGKNKGVPYLRCPEKGCCAGTKYEFVERALLVWLEELTRDLFPAPSSAEPLPEAAPAVRRRIAAQRSRLAARRERLFTLLEDGVYSPEQFALRTRVLEEDERALNRAEEELDGRPSPPQTPARSVIDCFRAAAPAGQRELLRLLVEDIVYAKEKGTRPAECSLTVTLRPF